MEEIETFEVEPGRLEPGTWCHTREKTVGEGDISRSYSAERVAMGQPIRPPFQWRGSFWVNVSTRYRGGVHGVIAYRLAHPSSFDGAARSYAEASAAQEREPRGFYHGMKVRARGGMFILCGPPALFVPGAVQQLSLF